jgi:hypothetical protein
VPQGVLIYYETYHILIGVHFRLGSILILIECTVFDGIYDVYLKIGGEFSNGYFIADGTFGMGNIRLQGNYMNMVIKCRLFDGSVSRTCLG